MNELVGDIYIRVMLRTAIEWDSTGSKIDSSQKGNKTSIWLRFSSLTFGGVFLLFLVGKFDFRVSEEF
jgi:hypothetical protein